MNEFLFTLLGYFIAAMIILVCPLVILALLYVWWGIINETVRFFRVRKLDGQWPFRKGE